MLTLPVLCIHSITKCSREDDGSLTGDPSGDRSASSHRYRHSNRLGIDGGLMRHVILVTEEKLERMLSEWKRDLRLGLSRAKMQVIEIIGNGLIQRRQWDVHHQVMVAGIGFFNTSRRHPHVDEAESYDRLARYVGSIGWKDEIDLGIGS